MGLRVVELPVPIFSMGVMQFTRIPSDALLAVSTHQIRFWKARLEPGSDRPAIAQKTAVVEFENRNAGERVAPQKLWGEVLLRVEVHRNQRQIADLLLGKNHAYPLGVGRPGHGV